VAAKGTVAVAAWMTAGVTAELATVEYALLTIVFAAALAVIVVDILFAMTAVVTAK